MVIFKIDLIMVFIVLKKKLKKEIYKIFPKITIFLLAWHFWVRPCINSRQIFSRKKFSYRLYSCYMALGYYICWIWSIKLVVRKTYLLFNQKELLADETHVLYEIFYLWKKHFTDELCRYQRLSSIVDTNIVNTKTTLAIKAKYKISNLPI